MRPRLFPVWIVVLASGATGLGCSGFFEPNPDIGRAQQELDAAKARWNDAGIQSYLFELDRACSECVRSGPPVKVEVRAGKVSRVTLEGGLLWPYLVSAYAVTVPDLFDIIQARIDFADRPDLFSVSYDADLGYPTTISIFHERPVPSDNNFIATVGSLTELDPLAALRAQERLDAARARWSAAGIESYVMELYRRYSTSPGPLARVEVRAGAVHSVTDAATGEPVTGEAYRRRALTVTTVFDIIQPRIQLADRPDLFFVAYDPDLGYPTTVHLAVDLLDILSLTVLDDST